MKHFLSFDNETLWRFEKAREDAVTAGSDVFKFDGHMVSTPYAKYIIEIVKRHFTRKKAMVGSGDVEGFEDIMAERKLDKLEAVIWKWLYGEENVGQIFSSEEFHAKQLAAYIRTHVTTL